MAWVPMSNKSSMLATRSETNNSCILINWISMMNPINIMIILYDRYKLKRASNSRYYRIYIDLRISVRIFTSIYELCYRFCISWPTDLEWNSSFYVMRYNLHYLALSSWSGELNENTSFIHLQMYQIEGVRFVINRKLIKFLASIIAIKENDIFFQLLSFFVNNSTVT